MHAHPWNCMQVAVYVTGDTAKELWLCIPDSSPSFMLIHWTAYWCYWSNLSIFIAEFSRIIWYFSKLVPLVCLTSHQRWPHPASAPVYDGRRSSALSGGQVIAKTSAMTHPGWHYSGWKSDLLLVMISLITGGQREGKKGQFQRKRR